MLCFSLCVFRWSSVAKRCKTNSKIKNSTITLECLRFVVCKQKQPFQGSKKDRYYVMVHSCWARHTAKLSILARAVLLFMWTKLKCSDEWTFQNLNLSFHNYLPGHHIYVLLSSHITELGLDHCTIQTVTTKHRGDTHIAASRLTAGKRLVIVSHWLRALKAHCSLKI